MRVKKSGGKIFGADLTVAERKALNMEIKRQMAEYDRKHKNELEAMVLWQLHEQLGFGVQRLKKFYYNFNPIVDELIERYQLEEDDGIWICTLKLKDLGIDIEEMSADGRED